MDLGIISNSNVFYLSALYQKNKGTGTIDGNEFLNAVQAKEAEGITAHIPYYKMDQATFLEYMDRTMAAGGSEELSCISKITKAYCTGKPDAASFEDAFPMYSVVTYVGNTNISDAYWQRNDFPFWQYYNKDASADCLNDWKPTGANPPLSDAGVQKGLNSIGAGKMAILIPDALQEKMDADPEYAKAVMAKVQRWKEDYDNWDNAAALSLGMNAAEHQSVKSYCIQLDEDGNVTRFVVSSPGRLTRSDDEAVKKYRARKKKQEEEAKMLLEQSIRAREMQRKIREEWI